MMIPALLRAIIQLPDPAIRRVIWISMTATVVGFIGMAMCVYATLYLLHITGIVWLDLVVDLLGGVAVLGLALLISPAVLPVVSGLFLDDVVAAVERRHYPQLPPPRLQHFREISLGAVRFMLVSIMCNLLVIPLYIVPGSFLVVYPCLNGYLLGREYFEQVASRHLDLAAALALRRRHRGRVFLAGVAICTMATIPVVNLLVPIIAAAFMTHVFHRLTHT
ncbi:MAG: EI24 domain-containing protein, partial [Rhodospirillaceae bacterium]